MCFPDWFWCLGGVLSWWRTPGSENLVLVDQHDHFLRCWVAIWKGRGGERGDRISQINWRKCGSGDGPCCVCLVSLPLLLLLLRLRHQERSSGLLGQPRENSSDPFMFYGWRCLGRTQLLELFVRLIPFTNELADCKIASIMVFIDPLFSGTFRVWWKDI